MFNGQKVSLMWFDLDKTALDFKPESLKAILQSCCLIGLNRRKTRGDGEVSTKKREKKIP